MRGGNASLSVGGEQGTHKVHPYGGGEQREKLALRRRCMPLVQYWGEGGKDTPQIPCGASG